ncbi:CcdB family protein [Agrobacterium sp. lyk4-40-TYG-31]|uniref:CcdB family protein n=1 Tax=Agrobacterium sp. lyk4-40-TYG-31 TaxID=3040276 RepID=UPI00255152F3|nr:CcdB family protein [Agrobacterium sp. lyk4-40-TYG-31]
MARFCVYKLVGSHILLLDLQADILDDLKTRVVAPLYPANELSWSLAKLSPRFLISSEIFVMATQRMVAVPVQEIGDFVADLSSRRDDIIAATDFLFQGF